MIIRVVTLGCKVNQCESASIVAALANNGYNASEGLELADVYVLNTCSVTAEADKKSRQYLAKMRKLNPSCQIIVIGCSSQYDKKMFYRENVVAVGGTHDKSTFVERIVRQIAENIDKGIPIDRVFYDENIENLGNICEYSEENYSKSQKTRAFIKIQDGCNRFCSYCIIPYLRGRSRSRAIASILDECSKTESKEIVLTGVDVSMYGLDTGESLPSLLRALSSVNARKRLSSLECEAVTEELLDAMIKGNFCPHFHLSLQSGSDAVLKSMNRRYCAEMFYEKVELIRKYFPLAAITTDIIVGFPTETDELFEESYAFAKKCRFADIHVFPYSRRAGTLADKKYGTLQPETIDSREKRLLELKSQFKAEFIDKNIGTVAPVYTETTVDGYSVGYTPNYVKVYADAPCGDIVNLRLTKNFLDGAFGEPV